MARSASRAAISPISGRLPRSRSPPQPNTTISAARAAKRPHRRDRPLERVGRVRVVDQQSTPRALATRSSRPGTAQPRRARRRWRRPRSPRATAMPTASARFARLYSPTSGEAISSRPTGVASVARVPSARSVCALDHDVGAARLAAGRPRHAPARAARPRAHPPPGLVVGERHGDAAARDRSAARTGSPWPRSSAPSCRGSRGGPGSGWSAPPPGTRQPSRRPCSSACEVASNTTSVVADRAHLGQKRVQHQRARRGQRRRRGRPPGRPRGR